MNSHKYEITVLNYQGQIETIELDYAIETISENGEIDTTSSIDKNVVDLSTSCNKSVAVAKLLGWFRGPVFANVLLKRPNTEERESRLYFSLLRVFKEDENSLEGLLSYFLNFNSRELAAAVDANEPPEVIHEIEGAIAHISSLIHQASKYKSDIESELTKDESSHLKIDLTKTNKTGVTHITLVSLDNWARQRYGISVLEDQEQLASTQNIQAQPIVQLTEEDPNPKDGFTNIKATNVMTTFGFLVEAFANTAPGFGGEKPNISNIAKHIANLAVKAGGQDEMDNQSYEAIRKRIKQAIDTKNSYLKKFGK